MTRSLILSRDQAEELVDMLEKYDSPGHLNGLALEIRELFGMVTAEQEAAYRVKLEHEKILLAALKSAWDKSRI